MTVNIGIRLEGSLRPTMNWWGGGIFCGSGGCSGAASGYAAIVPIDLSAGAIIGF